MARPYAFVLTSRDGEVSLEFDEALCQAAEDSQGATYEGLFKVGDRPHVVARDEAVSKFLDWYEEFYVKPVPLGAEDHVKGSSVFNWRTDVLRQMRRMLKEGGVEIGLR